VEHLNLRFDGPLENVPRPAAHQLFQRQTDLGERLPSGRPGVTCPAMRIAALSAPRTLLLWVSTTALSATVRRLLDLYQAPLIHQIRA